MTEKDNLLSVLLITYNQEAFIQEAIESILMQECDFDFELIIADDCSSDKTSIIIEQLINDHPKINIIKHQKHLKNLGMIPNFIWALKQAKGKYIALCEGDDYWTDPLKLQKQVDFMESNTDYSSCFHYTSMQFEETPGKKGKLCGFHVDQLNFTVEDTFTKLSPWHTSSFVFRKNTLLIPSWFLEIASGDMGLFSIVSKSGMIRCIPEVMSAYRKHAGGITNTPVHKAKLYHVNRIKLVNHLNEFHSYKYSKKAEFVINFHQDEIAKLDNTKQLKNTRQVLLKRIYNKFVSVFRRKNNKTVK